MTVIDLPRTRGKPPRLRGAVPDAGRLSGTAIIGRLTRLYGRLSSGQLRLLARTSRLLSLHSVGHFGFSNQSLVEPRTS
jgi:hypothetical protein